tara:strand:+ start:15297 stop:15884 length:588 start_codon:yes stop_codon:yes gene_type:complete
MNDPIPNSTRQTEAQRPEEYDKPLSSVMANDPDAVLIPDIGAQLSLGIKQRAKKRVNSTRKTKTSLAESLVNVAIAAMLENPCMDMKDMWPVLEELVPGASGDTFQRKLRAKLRELNNADINKILKPRHRKGTVKPSKANQEVGAPVKKPSAKLMEQPSQSADIDATPVQKPKNDDQGDIPKDFLLGLNANSSGF